jgi:cytochrome c biogenesis protein CcmG/thiol:disulfide interchange protein DsbE
LYALVYGTLTSISSDHEKDWLFRLSLSTLAMVLPVFGTMALAVSDWRRHVLPLSGRIGVAVAVLSLGLVWSPCRDGITRWQQTRNLALQNVPAPLFDTLDLSGSRQRLLDQKGKVVLVNIWATWCGPCRSEMPKLDGLYRSRKDQGFVVFGLSDEDVAVQRKFLERNAVSYPLLTINGQIPALYREIARYPAIFLIDRSGRLQPAPSPDQPFDKIEPVVASLLKSGP